MTVQNVTIIARTWFDSKNGNTYHSVRVLADGEEIALVPMTYGYGEQWKETATVALDEAGIIERERYESEAKEPLWQIAKREGFEVTTDVTEVSKEKDLHS